MSSLVKDVIVDAGGSAASPSTPLLPSDCPRNTSVRRLRCSDTDLEEKPHCWEDKKTSVGAQPRGRMR
ncbi:hypothetical protein NQZ68_021055 [Dissostichus eleginoides]|nr:hypothetical protein NQZ68_021055 [Dissostichus eleginoides]